MGQLLTFISVDAQYLPHPALGMLGPGTKRTPGRLDLARSMACPAVDLPCEWHFRFPTAAVCSPGVKPQLESDPPPPIASPIDICIATDSRIPPKCRF